MNKRLFFLGLISILAVLASCQREMDWSDTPEIRATVEEQPETKTYLYSGAGAIYWSPADKIDVFFGTTRATYTSQNTLNSKTAVFKTNDSIGSSELSSTNIWGLYPSNSSSSCNGSSVTTTLPSTQYGVPNTFDDDLFLAVAHSTSTSLQFYNVCGGIKFNLAYDDIKKITFRGNNNENLAGKVSISFESGVPKATIVSGVKEITLTPKTGTTFTKGVDYYITLLPGTLSSGFKMTFTTTNGTTGTFNYTDNPVTIKRSVFSKKSNMDAYASFGDERQPSNVIYYTSTDGKVVTPYKTDVFGASIVSNTYTDNRGILEFDGPVTKVGEKAFYWCNRLKSISIPEGCTIIGKSAFESAKGLSLIHLPSSLRTLSGYSIYGCESLRTIILPEGLTFIGDWAFCGCSSLSDITIPQSVTYMGGAFADCTSLTHFYGKYADADGNLLTDGVSLMAVAPSWLESFSIPEGIQYICPGVFCGFRNLSSISLPEGLQSIGFQSFLNCTGLSEIVIPESVISIGNGAFEYCSSLTSITVKASTPPSLEDNVFRNTNNCPIYVPAGSVDAYKSAWSVYSDRIQAIQPSFQASYFDIRTQGLTIQLSNQHGIYSVPLLNAVTITDDGRNQILSNGIWLTGNGQNGIPDGVTATDYYNIYYNIEFDTYSLPSDLRELVTLELDNNDQLAFVFDYSKTDKTFTGTYTVPFLIRFNTDLGSYNAMFDLVIKGVTPEAVDLGLSVKWASFNLGAAAPEEYGDYYAWGETEPYYSSLDPLVWKEGKSAGYDWPSYQWCNGSETTLIRYCPIDKPNYWGGSGTPDGKTEFKDYNYVDDAARQCLGGKWRVQTDAEWAELLSNCTWTWTTQNGVYGYMVTSNKTGYTDKSIFLPAAGLREGTSLDYVGSYSYGFYWSSSLNTGYPNNAWSLQLNSSGVDRYDFFPRYFGFSVRPVSE